MVDTCQNLFNSRKTFFDISINTCLICMGFEADTPEKVQKYAYFMRLWIKALV